MKKEFGKFTEQQIREFIFVMPGLFESRSAYHAELRKTPSKLPKLTPEPLNWSWAYELSMDEHVASATVAFGLAENLTAFANSADPQQAVLDDLKTDLPAGHKSLTSIQSVLELTEGMARSMECLIIYGKYINEIIADVRESIQGSEDWLFKAIRIDPTVITCTTAQDRLCRAILLDDQHFMSELHKALKGKTGSQVKYLNDFRFLMQLLHESESGELSNAKIRDLVFKLDIYKDVGDAQHNVAELIRTHKKKIKHFKS